MLSGVYDKNSKEFDDADPFVSELTREILEEIHLLIRDSEILQRGNRSDDIWNLFNRIYVGESFELKINGTFTYQPYPDFIQIENREKFNILYNTKKVQRIHLFSLTVSKPNH